VFYFFLVVVVRGAKVLCAGQFFGQLLGFVDQDRETLGADPGRLAFEAQGNQGDNSFGSIAVQAG